MSTHFPYHVRLYSPVGLRHSPLLDNRMWQYTEPFNISLKVYRRTKLEDAAHSIVCKSNYTAIRTHSRQILDIFLTMKFLQSIIFLSRIRRKGDWMEFRPRHQSSWYTRGFSLVLLLNADYYVILSHQRLIPLPLQFIIHYYTIILQLVSVTDGVLKHAYTTSN